MNDPNNWLDPLALGALGVALVVIGIIRGVYVANRERKRLEEVWAPPERGTMTGADIVELAARRRDRGGPDAA
jgi:hypothetical protein